MIQKLQFGTVGCHSVNSIAKSSAPSKVSNSLSFKGGNELYEETLSLIDDAKRRAEIMGVSKLTGVHPDGVSVTFIPTKKGMELSVQNDKKLDKDFQKKYGNGYRLETRNSWVMWTNQYPAFMLYEVPEGEFDAVIQKYLPVVMK